MVENVVDPPLGGLDRGTSLRDGGENMFLIALYSAVDTPDFLRRVTSALWRGELVCAYDGTAFIGW